ncbi:hypothetical protein G2W53_036245 [Senna tora]|uniref:Uncharacterized protein n=1 Tax=Senna tora TaxID=362788 RepID=A0A834STJ6_9FABA|nr:hypothetical protein G2W53_036245 [Senna tora]
MKRENLTLRHEIMHNTEKTLLHFPGVLGAEDDHFPPSKIKINASGGSHVVSVTITGELSSIVYSEVRSTEFLQLFRDYPDFDSVLRVPVQELVIDKDLQIRNYHPHHDMAIHEQLDYCSYEANLSTIGPVLTSEYPILKRHISVIILGREGWGVGRQREREREREMTLSKEFRFGDINIPDGLELLFLTLFFGHIGEGALSPINGSGGCRFLPLQRVEFINGLSLHRRSTAVVANSVLFLLRLNLRQSVPCRPVTISEAEISVTVASHLRLPAHTLIQISKKELDALFHGHANYRAQI